MSGLSSTSISSSRMKKQRFTSKGSNNRSAGSLSSSSIMQAAARSAGAVAKQQIVCPQTRGSLLRGDHLKKSEVGQRGRRKKKKRTNRKAKTDGGIKSNAFWQHCRQQTSRSSISDSITQHWATAAAIKNDDCRTATQAHDR